MFGSAHRADRCAPPMSCGMWCSFQCLHCITPCLRASAVRRALTQRIWAPLERSFYVWVASLLFIAVCKLWLPVPGIVWEVEGAASFILIVLQIGGITFSVYSAAAIDVWELAGIRQLNSRLQLRLRPLPTPPPSRPEPRRASARPRRSLSRLHDKRRRATPKRSSNSRRQDLTGWSVIRFIWDGF